MGTTEKTYDYSAAARAASHLRSLLGPRAHLELVNDGRGHYAARARIGATSYGLGPDGKVISHSCSSAGQDQPTVVHHYPQLAALPDTTVVIDAIGRALSVANGQLTECFTGLSAPVDSQHYPMTVAE